MRWLVVGAALLLAGCVTRGTYDAEVARATRLERALQEESARAAELERRVSDLTATRETLELERRSLGQERLELLDEIESVRQGNEGLRQELLEERSIREQRESEIEELTGTYSQLVEHLESEVQAGQIEIHRLRGRLQVRALERILFDSGSAQIKPQGRRVLEKVAKELKGIDGHRVVVEGHTDSRPISTERYPSNWELSAARGASVVRLLVGQGLDPTRVSAAGYGPFHPIADNASAAGRARNRRIEIVLVPDGAE